MSVVLAVACALLVLAVFVPGFEVNDDTAMLRIAAGLNGTPPSEYLVFSHFGIGLLLSWLYGHTQAINWYGGYLYTVLLAATAAIFYCLLAGENRRYRVLRCAAVIVLICSPWLLRVSFTVCAILAGLAGYLLLALFAAQRSRGWGPVAVGLALTSIAAMVRIESFYLASILVLPCLALRWWQTRSRLLVVAWAAALVLGLGLELANRLYYRTDRDWGDYLEYNLLRAAVHDTPLRARAAEVNELARARAGWNENDAALIHSFFFDDSTVYSKDRLRAYVTTLLAAPRAVSASFAQYAGIVRKSQPLWWLACLGFCLAVAGTRRRECLLLLLPVTALVLGLGYALLSMAKIEDRVWLPMLQYVALVALVWAGSGEPRAGAQERWARAAVIGLTMVLLVAGVSRAREFRLRSQENARKWRQLKDMAHAMRQLDAEHPGPVLFAPQGDELRLGAFSPVKSSRAFAGLNLLMGGWGTMSPLNKEQLRRFGMENLFTDVVDRDDVMLVLRPLEARRYARFMREHHGKTVVMQSVPLPPAFVEVKTGKLYRVRSGSVAPVSP